MEQTMISQAVRRTAPTGLTNRQRLARYDRLIELAQERADRAPSLAIRRRYVRLILRLQQRALRGVNRAR